MPARSCTSIVLHQCLSAIKDDAQPPPVIQSVYVLYCDVCMLPPQSSTHAAEDLHVRSDAVWADAFETVLIGLSDDDFHKRCQTLAKKITERPTSQSEASAELWSPLVMQEHDWARDQRVATLLQGWDKDVRMFHSRRPQHNGSFVRALDRSPSVQTDSSVSNRACCQYSPCYRRSLLTGPNTWTTTERACGA